MRRHAGPPDVYASRVAPIDEVISAMGDDRFQKALAAAERYRRRSTGDEMPQGAVGADGVWTPTAWENRGITDGVERATPDDPLVYLVACRRLDHCASLEHAVLWDALQVSQCMDHGELSRGPESLGMNSSHAQRKEDIDTAIPPLPRPRRPKR